MEGRGTAQRRAVAAALAAAHIRRRPVVVAGCGGGVRLVSRPITVADSRARRRLRRRTVLGRRKLRDQLSVRVPAAEAIADQRWLSHAAVHALRTDPGAVALKGHVVKKPARSAAATLTDGVRCSVVGGTHAGKSGTVADIKTSKTGHVTLTVIQANGKRFKTLAKNVAVQERSHRWQGFRAGVDIRIRARRITWARRPKTFP